MEAEKIFARLANSLDNEQERLKVLEQFGTSAPEQLSELIFIHLDLHVAEKNHDKAEELVKIAEEFSRFYREPFFIYQLFKKKAKFAEERGDIEKTFSLYEELITLAKDMHREDIEAEVLMEMGIVFEKQGAIDEALEKFLTASEIYKRLGHNYNYAASLFNIAYIYYDRGDLDSSLSYCLQALEVDEGEQFQTLEAHVNLELANIYETRKEALLSKLYYQKALEGYQKGKDRVKVSDILYKLGALLHQEKRIPHSLHHYQNALHMKMDIDYTQALAKYYYYRACVFKDCGAHNKAIKYFDKALYLYSQLGQEKQCLRVKFQIYSIFGKTDDRIFFLPEFVRSYKTPPFKDVLVDKAVRGIYTRRKSDGKKLPFFKEKEGNGSTLIDRRSLSSLLRDMSRAHYAEGNSKKYKHYSQQFKVVKDFRAGQD
ncbi:MAG: tetratricopeptide repeat protein [Candidatus Eremiobacteraeota bacterium]|nr:tetratricopeptide repeat protein [Candidatus Eremiobacteraeota bacterium]